MDAYYTRKTEKEMSLVLAKTPSVMRRVANRKKTPSPSATKRKTPVRQSVSVEKIESTKIIEYRDWITNVGRDHVCAGCDSNVDEQSYDQFPWFDYENDYSCTCWMKLTRLHASDDELTYLSEKERSRIYKERDHMQRLRDWNNLALYSYYNDNIW